MQLSISKNLFFTFKRIEINVIYFFLGIKILLSDFSKILLHKLITNKF